MIQSMILHNFAKTVTKKFPPNWRSIINNNIWQIFCSFLQISKEDHGLIKPERWVQLKWLILAVQFLYMRFPKMCTISTNSASCWKFFDRMMDGWCPDQTWNHTSDPAAFEECSCNPKNSACMVQLVSQHLHTTADYTYILVQDLKSAAAVNSTFLD